MCCHRSEPNTVLIHVRMLENTAQLQAEALGILGVNLIHGGCIPALIHPPLQPQIDLQLHRMLANFFPTGQVDRHPLDECADLICGSCILHELLSR